MPLPSSSSKRATTSSAREVRGTQRSQKTEIKINVYDLLPPGRLSSILWTIGGSLLHSGVVINGKEYAYGGHNQRGITGVYWTKPRFEPPGGRFRCDIVQGFTFRTPQEVDEILRDVSQEFLGERYNLLSCNCNHFTSALCERLAGKPAPSWLNRAASIGVALPCVVPREWVAPPDVETADGELLEEESAEEGERHEEDVVMLLGDWRAEAREEQRRKKDVARASEAAAEDNGQHSLAGGKRIVSREDTPPPRLVAVRDTSGRKLPVAERAPVPKKP